MLGNYLLFSQLLFFLSCSVLAWWPTNSYAPGYVNCPSEKKTLIREANGLSPEELAWLAKRHQVTQANLAKFLKYTAKLNESDYAGLLSNNAINIGLSFSGGGYRAMLTGAGQLAALDNTTVGAFEHGLGGLLESTTYFAGLSGGNWLLGTLAMNNWTSVQKILDHKVSGSSSIWDLTNPLYAPAGANLVKDEIYWYDWFKDIERKAKAGFEVSFIDVWARGLSDVFYPKANDYGAAATWSSISEIDVFTSGQMPFPISVSDAKWDDTDLTYLSSTIFETNPYEFGTWDPTGSQFAAVKYLGTNITNGIPADTSRCVTGFDNGGFVMATSSNVFSMPADDFVEDVEKVKLLYKLFEEELDFIDDVHIDKAVYPNPFYGSSYGTLNTFATSKELTLVDGGQDDEVIPLVPVMLEKRANDVVFAFDNCADNNNWPNGQAVVYTYERQFADIGKDVFSFPYVPPSSTFQAKGFNKRPTFFGCDAKNLTGLASVPPLLVYMPNMEHSYASNVATLQLMYSDLDKRGMIRNGFEGATRNNRTEDASFATCVGCAVIRRAQERAGAEQSEACQKCFEQYCWDGTV